MTTRPPSPTRDSQAWTTYDVADAFDKIAEGYAAAAMVLRFGAETPQDAPGGAPLSYPEDLPFGDEAAYDEAQAKPAGSAAVCPAHNIPYRKGRYGMYCPSTSEDPNWRNDKGYCTITPKSAAAWMRQHA